jgi:hypothetical protein
MVFLNPMVFLYSSHIDLPALHRLYLLHLQWLRQLQRFHLQLLQSLLPRLLLWLRH